MSSLAQAEESVHGEQHAVQLQNFMKVAEEGEGIRRVGLPGAAERTPVQQNTHEHQDRARAPAHKHRQRQSHTAVYPGIAFLTLTFVRRLA